MSIANAFRTVLKIHSRQMTIERPGAVAAVSISVTPSNYFRNLSSPEELVVEGREFIISKDALVQASFPMPRRGDRLKDSEIGINVISEVREIYGFGGEIMGFRLRTS